MAVLTTLVVSLVWPNRDSGAKCAMFCLSFEYAVRFPTLNSEEVVSQPLIACDAGKQLDVS